MSPERPAATPASLWSAAQALPLLLAGLAATAALKLATLGIEGLACGWLLPMVVGLAWPLWAQRREQAMFVRRLLLAGATVESGWVRRWLWRGTVAQALGVVPALSWAAVLLLMATQLTPWQWGILVVDAAALALLSPWLRQRLRSEVAPAYVDTVARRWPLLLANAGALLAAFVAHDYLLGFADTRALSWDALVAQTLQSAQGSVSCPTAATLVGVAALADRLPRHAALLFVPGVADAQIRLLVWLVFLAFTAFGAYLFTRFLLGMQVLLEGWQAGRAPAAGPQPAHRLFAWTALVLLAAAAAAAKLGLSFDTQVLGQGAVQLARVANPCGRQQAQTVALQAASQRRLDAATQQAVQAAMKPVDAGLDLAFAAADKGIDKYLDWYFSFVGSYTRLGALLIPDLDAHMRKQFSTLVFTDSGFDQSVARASGEADALLMGRIAAEAEAISQGLAARLKLELCLHESVQPAALAGLSRDATRLALSAAVALPLSRVVLPLALRAGEAVLARAAARQTVKAAASAAGGTAGKRGAAVLLSATACAPGGPLALFCGAAAWVAADLALIAIDEALFRKSLRAELVEELQAQRKSLRDALQAQVEQAAATYSEQARQRIDQVFVPANDG